ncbi:uncharacterized protein BP5553_10431 [Venustampulla echinocandica]|uniref:Uncharacterized protein n=1 Tax=Venustampulla echinocandica TaxID=2656787 RepID=A0A370T9B1_9HELO|nr:uncharacterized protein BP5553_10431 [Venustampulla echinocandica]RDL30153.1 hypothetical protein BP5553_10431 [Venustampulla echinocandica]
MCATCNQTIRLNGNGGKVEIQNTDHLWEQQNKQTKGEPLYYLVVTALKDQEAQGDCSTQRFEFQSLRHLTNAVDQIEAGFGGTVALRKCGGELPDAMGGRVNDGRCENVTIEFDSNTAQEGWDKFLLRLRGMEKEWRTASQ